MLSEPADNDGTVDKNDPSSQHGHSDQPATVQDRRDQKDVKIDVANEPPEYRYLPGQRLPRSWRLAVKMLSSVFFVLVIDVGLPLALYYGLRNVIKVVYALIIAGIPPFLWVIAMFIIRRRIEPLGVIIAASFILSAVISLASGNARLALLRDGAVTAVVGGMFFFTLIPIRKTWFDNRPMTFLVSRQFLSELPPVSWIDKDGEERRMLLIDWMWQEVRFFRWNMYIQTAAWGFLLIMEFVATVIMVKSTLSVDDIVKYHNIINGSVIGFMTTCSSFVDVIQRRKAREHAKGWIEENVYTEYYENLRAQGNTTTA